MKELLLVVGTLLLTETALADGRKVIVLEPNASSPFAWPAGERAVVAELVASDVPLVVRTTRVTTLAELEQELAAVLAEPDTLGAVTVAREGQTGFALVRLSDAAHAVRLEDAIDQGVVAQGAIALRVSEIVRARTFELPLEPASERRPAPVPAPGAPDRGPSLFPWVGVGVLAAAGSSSPAAALALGLRVPLVDWLSVEGAGTVSLGALHVETAPGRVELGAKQATLELVLSPPGERTLSAGLGLGGGLVWISATPEAEAGYTGVESSTRVPLLSARAVGLLSTGRLRLMAFAEASLLVPAVTVYAGDDEVAEVGPLWLLAGLAAGFEP